jgi:hypothetical protein
MTNPWLTIPLADYEGHMASAQVQQSGALADLFAEAIELCHPASVAVLGVAGGNGLDRIDSEMMARVVAVDINPLYLEAVRQRYAHLNGLELHCVDLAQEGLHLPPVELVHAALIFEHAGTGRCLENALRLVAEDGALSVVLQLPTEAGQNAGKGGFAATHGLQSIFILVDPKQLCASLKERTFELIHERRRSLPEGKAFWMGVFVRG